MKKSAKLQEQRISLSTMQTLKLPWFNKKLIALSNTKFQSWKANSIPIYIISMEMFANKLKTLKQIKPLIYTNLIAFLCNGKNTLDILMNQISNAHMQIMILSMVSVLWLRSMVKLLIVRVTVVSINSKSHLALTLKEHILSPDVEINFSGEDLMVQMERFTSLLPLLAIAIADFILHTIFEFF